MSNGPSLIPGSAALQPLSLDDLQTAQRLWQHRLAERQAELARLEAEAGRLVLMGQAESYRQKLADAKAGVNECRLVLAEIAQQLPLGQAAELRRQAAAELAEMERLKTEILRIETALQSLLEQVEALQGVKYAPPATNFRGAGQTNTARMHQRILALETSAENKLFRAQQLEQPPAPGQSSAWPEWEVAA
jgi:hypothetical protein